MIRTRGGKPDLSSVTGKALAPRYRRADLERWQDRGRGQRQARLETQVA